MTGRWVVWPWALRPLATQLRPSTRVRERLGHGAAAPLTTAKSLRIAYERQGSLLKSINFKPE